MLKYTVKRLAQSLVTILLIGTIVFLLMRCLPTDYYFTEEQLMKFTEEQKYAALEAAGLTDPIGTQLLDFYNDLLHLDFGTSRRIQNGASVVKVIGKKFGVSMRLGLISAGSSLLVGIMLGILQTAFKDKVFDWIGTAYTVSSTLCLLWSPIRWCWSSAPNTWVSPRCTPPVMSARPACCPSSACRWRLSQATLCGPAATWWTS